MSEEERKEIIEALKICSSYAPTKCDHCPFGWMEDHGKDCQPAVAEKVLELLGERTDLQHILLNN